MSRTPAYWPTRILLGVGIVATMLAVGLAFVVGTQPTPPFDPSTYVLGLPPSAVRTFALAGIAVVGLVWMVLIFRGPRDKPPRWLYRDR
jgi:hypothetical protein